MNVSLSVLAQVKWQKRPRKLQTTPVTAVGVIMAAVTVLSGATSSLIVTLKLSIVGSKMSAFLASRPQTRLCGWIRSLSAIQPDGAS